MILQYDTINPAALPPIKEENTMKKLLSCLLALSLSLSLMACGGAGADTIGGADSSTEIQVTDDAASNGTAGGETADGETADGETVQAAALSLAKPTGEEAAAAYDEKVTELKYKSGGDVFWAVISCGTGENILLTAKEIFLDGEAIEADVYQFADGQIKLLGSVASTGTAYPLSYTSEAVLSGGNHTAGKLVVGDGTADLYQVTNMNIEGRSPLLTVTRYGEDPAEEEISIEEAVDYYTEAYASETAEVILFQN